MHVNREVLDTLLAAAIVLLTLKLADRPTLPLALGTGAVTGLAILGNSRLIGIPLVLGAYLAWRRGWTKSTGIAFAALAVAAVVTIVPWATRNQVQVGCFTITTDSKALWKANNPDTYDVLEQGGWIDDVPNLPGSPSTPEMAFGAYQAHGTVDARGRVRPDALLPAPRARLLARRAGREDSPRRAGDGDALDARAGRRRAAGPAPARGSTRRATGRCRSTCSPLYVGAAVGVWRLPRAFVVLAVALLAYQTVAAMIFAGATRYRVPWDFLLALLAGGALVHVLTRRRRLE